MLRRRMEKLEATLPMSACQLLERLDWQALNTLSGFDRELAREKLRAAGSRRKSWSAEHQAAEARYLESFGLLLQDVSDAELESLIAQEEHELGRLVPKLATSSLSKPQAPL
jgi:hypothetical protein